MLKLLFIGLLIAVIAGVTIPLVTGPSEIRVDCALLGGGDGVAGPGTLFTVDFTGLAVGASPLDITIIDVRDTDNNPLPGFSEEDGTLVVLAGASEPGRGLVMLEIDGLSYHHMKKALAEGYLPTLQKMMDEEGYGLAHVDCGLPSQTSACQAGIMFGDNYDIPAFRWFDKDEDKLFQSGQDAEVLNARYAHGKGLLRGGTSIVNMMAGDEVTRHVIQAAARRFRPVREQRAGRGRRWFGWARPSSLAASRRPTGPVPPMG